MAWTRFYDLHGGGYRKTDFNSIYIEAELEEAVRIFEEKLDYNPITYSCDCCGPDFIINEEDEENVPEQSETIRVISLEELTSPKE